MSDNGNEHEQDYTFTEGDDGGDQLETFADDGDDDVTDETKANKTGDLSDLTEDPELEAIKARVREMEEEAEKLKEMQSDYEKQMNLSSSSLGSPSTGFPSIEDKIEADSRSVYVGNVDYGATAQELEAHFHGCGSINRVTILCDKFTGHPKGFAYIEFADSKDSIQTSVALDESLFRGRQIKVIPKRTNRPGISSTDRAPRGRPRRARTSYHYGGGYAPPRRRGFRPRRSWHYTPY